MLGSMDNVSTLRAAIDGFRMEHGFAPDLIAMSADVAKAVINECMTQKRYASVIRTGGAMQPMTLFDIEVAQLQGTNTVKLMSDLTTAKALRSLK